MKYELNKGIGKKSGQPYYSIVFTIAKFKSEPTFISEIEYDYLQSQKIENSSEEEV